MQTVYILDTVLSDLELFLEDIFIEKGVIESFFNFSIKTINKKQVITSFKFTNSENRKIRGQISCQGHTHPFRKIPTAKYEFMLSIDDIHFIKELLQSNSQVKVHYELLATIFPAPHKDDYAIIDKILENTYGIESSLFPSTFLFFSLYKFPRSIINESETNITLTLDSYLNQIDILESDWEEF